MRILRRRYNIKDVVDAYITAALWTTELDDLRIYDISDEDRKQMTEEIEWFIDKMNKFGPLINRMTDDYLGHDLWLSRNGHGSGFMDRYYPERMEEILYDLSDALGEAYLFSDDDKVYYESSDKYKTWDLDKYIEERKFKDDVKKYNL